MSRMLEWLSPHSFSSSSLWRSVPWLTRRIARLARLMSSAVIFVISLAGVGCCSPPVLSL
uniref:Uncharacterized protein n=1 Tax=uncultured marine virus TaxID=186617 RepID=A0A0F7LAI8_9VIRU|nr:hypothetical protein [uncultured marine virus]